VTRDLLVDVSTLLSTYALGYDTQDAVTVADCFLDDGTFDLLLPDGSTMTFRGRDAVHAFMVEQLEGQDDLRRHFTTNLRVIEQGEGRVRVGSYLLLGAIDASGLRIVQSGRYDDVVEWHDGTARFRSRHLTMDGTF
jgi:hypothetical protein